MILKKDTGNPNEPLELPAVESSEALIEEAKNGNDEAFGQLVTIYEKFVYNTACRTLLSSGCGLSDAEDVAQASFIKAWRSLASFRGECAFSTWIYRITLNTARDYVRARARHGALSLTVENPEDGEESLMDIPVSHGDEIPEESLERRETIAAVREAIEQLPEDQKKVVVLRDLHELPYGDISALLGIEIGTVKSRINRGRQALKRILLKKNILE